MRSTLASSMVHSTSICWIASTSVAPPRAPARSAACSRLRPDRHLAHHHRDSSRRPTTSSDSGSSVRFASQIRQNCSGSPKNGRRAGRGARARRTRTPAASARPAGTSAAGRTGAACPSRSAWTAVGDAFVSASLAEHQKSFSEPPICGDRGDRGAVRASTSLAIWLTRASCRTAAPRPSAPRAVSVRMLEVDLGPDRIEELVERLLGDRDRLDPDRDHAAAGPRRAARAARSRARPARSRSSRGSCRG